MSRTSVKPTLNENDIKELESIINNPFSSDRLVTRARIILMSGEGAEDKIIAQTLNERPNTVSDWRKRYLAQGIVGLKDQERVGRRGSGKPNPADLVREKIETIPPAGQDKWTSQMLSDEIGVSVQTIRRALNKNGIVLGCHHSWEMDADAGTDIKSVDFAGMYLSGTEAALILCISSIQSMEHDTGFVMTRNSRLADALKKEGTEDSGLDLVHALDIAARYTATSEKGRHVSLQSFLNLMLDSLTPSQDAEYQVILFSKENVQGDRPAMQRSSVFVTTTPDLNSWIGQASFWAEMLCNRNRDTVDGLGHAIRSFIGSALSSSEPFQWRRRDIKWSCSTSDISYGEAALPSAFDDPSVNSVIIMNAEIWNRDGLVTTSKVSAANAVPAIDQIDYSNPVSFSASQGALEQGILQVSKAVSAGIFKGYMDDAAKKNR